MSTGMGMGGNPSGNSSGNLSSGSMSGNLSSNLGDSKGTLSEERNKKKGGSDVAEIIDSGAGGLDSITGFISSFTGKGPTNSNTNYSPPAPPVKKTNPLLIGGIVAGVFLLIIVLILTKNGQVKE
jgi:hypothetical protein